MNQTNPTAYIDRDDFIRRFGRETWDRMPKIEIDGEWFVPFVVTGAELRAAA